jgi:hypothetical protein
MAMEAPKNLRLRADFDEWFPQGLFLVGEIAAVMEYQSQEDRARNRPLRPRMDEVSGLPLYRDTFADPAAEKDRDKSFPVEFACAHQPVPPAAIAGLPFRPVVLEGMTVAPRAETSGQAKWIIWTIRATGMKAPSAASASVSGAGKPTLGQSSADSTRRAAA